MTEYLRERKLLNFRCLAKLLEEFDETWKRLGKYKNRTHALHTAMKFFIEQNKTQT